MYNLKREVNHSLIKNPLKKNISQIEQLLLAQQVSIYD
jgi:hypothetical protein